GSRVREALPAPHLVARAETATRQEGSVTLPTQSSIPHDGGVGQGKRSANRGAEPHARRTAATAALSAATRAAAIPRRRGAGGCGRNLAIRESSPCHPRVAASSLAGPLCSQRASKAACRYARRP